MRGDVTGEGNPRINAKSGNLASDETLGELETVALFGGAMPTDMTVSRGGRFFVDFVTEPLARPLKVL